MKPDLSVVRNLKRDEAYFKTLFTLQNFGHGMANQPYRDLNIQRCSARLDFQARVSNFKKSVPFTLRKSTVACPE